MSGERRQIVIIGGGITGLAAAFYLEKEIKKNDLPAEVTLVEASPRLGGKIQTVHKDGYVIERGPDSFLERKQSAPQLVKDLGLEHLLVNNATGQSYVLVSETLYPIPEGAVMGVPTKIGPFLTTGLFSLPGKLRAGMDLVLPASKPQEDQSLGEFFRRRVGGEVVENLIEPLLSGIYAGDIDRLSLMSTFPQFYQTEQKYRSLIIGMKKSRGAQSAGKPANKKKGQFQTVKTGLQTIVEELEKQLGITKVYKGTKVVSIERAGSAYSMKLDNGKVLHADSAVVTAPHKAAAAMFQEEDWLKGLEDMVSTSVANVALGFPKEAVQMEHQGTGFVISRNSDFSITACTWTNKKWPSTTPEGKVLLRAYVGKAGDESVVEQSDNEMVKIVLDDLKRIMKIDGEPEMTCITRWHEAMPQYHVGHKKRIKEIREGLEASYPGIFMTGASFEGVGIPDCIDQGKQAVADVLSHLFE
ncbi:protoporphyrinogen oxidase [Bacillus haynesii]|uniref:Coproporphyrinogen III oxidase n=1 Tax=Bacillus haynesii TaxID=1925021 RepID=A0AA90EXG0_9BACI|nr:protoporphyrinogen oxidase [Bacillus haynesii]MCY7771066.1 protoporphyrinogen oxidase [Bacillus haynesii]MCY7790084.1 protoporphyrinogen oxidase [Bacillus haynesii]MCY7849556.1 protoporphyrinogen oxidase [Bacillus haynesii]MCY7861428.1 protoporphyrinogen oxidase [Bacillus haynesii]MCY7913402.1 protoporphyrinogen oxidase [Bacillus haynesii]